MPVILNESTSASAPIKSYPTLSSLIDQKAQSRNENLEPGVIVVSIGRNVAKVLRKHDNVRDWVEFAQQFKNYHIIFFENGSHDGTNTIIRSALKKYEKDESKYTFESKSLSQSSKRTQNIANARNEYVRIIRDKFLHDERFQYVVILDMDQKCYQGVNATMMKHLMTDRKSEWDILSFVPNKPEQTYWDVWAFRDSPDNPNVKYEVDHNSGKGIYPYNMFSPVAEQSKHSAISEITESRFIDSFAQTEQDGLLSVESAFAGFALYKLSLFDSLCTYSSENLDWGVDEKIRRDNPDCEHVPFHRCLIEKRKARVRIIPQNYCNTRQYDWFNHRIPGRSS